MVRRPPQTRDTRDLVEAVRTRRARQAQWRQEGERSIGQNLALIGVLGWLVVTPALLGILAGRWLDHEFRSGVFWTLGLLVAGIFAGCALAWRRIHSA